MDAVAFMRLAAPHRWSEVKEFFSTDNYEPPPCEVRVDPAWNHSALAVNPARLCEMANPETDLEKFTRIQETMAIVRMEKVCFKTAASIREKRECAIATTKLLLRHL